MTEIVEDWEDCAEVILLRAIRQGKRVLGLVAAQPSTQVLVCARAVAQIAAQSGYHCILADFTSQAGADLNSEEIAAFEISSEHHRKPYTLLRVTCSESSRYDWNNSEWVSAKVEELAGNYHLVVLRLPSLLNRRSVEVNPLSLLQTCDQIYVVWERDAVLRSAVKQTVSKVKGLGSKIEGIILMEGSITEAERAARFYRRVFWFKPSWGRFLERWMLDNQ